MNQEKNRTVGYFLALFLGGVGAHLFYYGKYKRGILYLLFCWTYVPIILGWIDLFYINKLHEEFWKNRMIQNRKAFDIENSNVDSCFFTEKQNEKFYDEEKLILPKYVHITTPQNILQGLYRKDILNIRKGITIEFSVSTSSKALIKDSLQYANTPGKPAQFIPLMAYYTTFKDLNKEQKKWYFYWREQVLKGIYPDTSLSYIFLFTYELLNYTFNQNAAFNISMLVRLYENYIERNDRLSVYLPRWISDFLVELEEDELSKEWWNQQDYAHGKLYSILKERTQPLGKISISLWKPYILSYRETAFFEKNKNKIYIIFKESIPLLEEAYLAKGKTLLDEWFRVGQRNETRHLFSGAVIDRKIREKVITVEFVTPKETLSTAITNLFRLSENVARLILGEKRELKVDEGLLPTGFKKKMIDKFQKTPDKVNPRFVKVQDKLDQSTGSVIPKRPEETEAPPKQKITLDFEKVAALKKESTSLQEEFEKRFGEFEEVVVNVNEENICELDKETEVTLKINQETNWSMAFETNEDFDEFVKTLNQYEREFLIGFCNLKRKIQESNSYLKTNGLMASVFINDLNEKAHEHLGDNLIEIDGEDYEIYEEFDSVLNKLKEGAK